MPTIDIMATAGGLADATLSNNASALSTLNTDTQIAASAAGLRANISIGAAASAIVLGEAALSTGLTVLATDVKAAQASPTALNVGNVIADGLSAVGDVVIVGTGYANGASFAFPEAKPELAALSAAGAALAWLGVAVHAATGGYDEGIEKLQGFGTALADNAEAELAGVADTVTNATEGATNSLQNTIANIISLFQDISAGSPSELQSDQNDIDQAATAAALAYAGQAPASEVIPQYTDISVINNTDSNGNLQSTSETDPDGSSQSFGVSNTGISTLLENSPSTSAEVQNNTSGGLNVSYYQNLNATGSPSSSVTYNPDGTTDTNNPDGTSTATVTNPDESTTSTTYAGPNGTGQEIGTKIVEPDGTIKGSLIIPPWDGESSVKSYTVNLAGYSEFTIDISQYNPGNLLLDANITINDANRFTDVYLVNNKPVSSLGSTFGLGANFYTNNGPNNTIITVNFGGNYALLDDSDSIVPNTQMSTVLLQLSDRSATHFSIQESGVTHSLTAANAVYDFVITRTGDLSQSDTLSYGVVGNLKEYSNDVLSNNYLGTASFSPGQTSAHIYITISDSDYTAAGNVFSVEANEVVKNFNVVATPGTATVLPPTSDALITGPTGTTSQTITGPSSSRSLAFIGNSTLNGSFNTGTLTVGTTTSPALVVVGPGSSVAGSSIIVLNGAIQLNGIGSVLKSSGTVTLNYGQNSASSTLSLSSGASARVGSIAFTPYTAVTGPVSAAGIQVDTTSSLEVGNVGGAAAGKITIDTGTTISGYGVLYAPGGIVDNGTIDAVDSMSLESGVSGTGTIQIESNATADLSLTAGPSTVALNFAGSNGTLAIEPLGGTKGLSEQGTISGFSSGDTISYNINNVSGALSPTTAVYSATGSNTGVLTFRSGATIIGTLNLAGNYVGDRFAVTPGGSAGFYNITVTPGDPLFDAAYYLAQNPDVAAAGVDPYQHYMTIGWKEGRNPSALFNTTYYENQNPDVKAAGVNPLTHFEQNGWKEGRDPSVNFSDAKYLAANADVKAAGIDPLQHYETNGQFEGRATYAATPHVTGPQDPLVDAAYVYAHNPAVAAAGLDATDWYNSVGWKAGANPDAFFDTNYYLMQNPDVKAAGVNPLQHFEASGWKEGRQPSLMFDDAKYLAANPDVAAAHIDPLQHYLSNGQFEGRMTFLTGPTAAADPLVNAAYYDPQLGATLIPTGTAAAQQAASSYLTTGWQKGLNPDAFFNTAYYLANNPDVAAAHVDPLLHYENYGWKEGRNPSAAFSTNKYEAAYADVKAAGIDPLLHYVQFGQAEGRTAFAV